jgi:hypothetical protein
MAMNLEEEIANELSQQMCSKIDFQILGNMLVEACGWHRVEIINRPELTTMLNISEWVETHCKGKHMRRDRTYVFEKQSDAVNFTLKWL